jgi:hypothetical protein
MRMRHGTIAVCVALLLSAALTSSAHAQDRASFVGSWHGELPVSKKTITGKSVDLRRWLSTFRSDGTYTIVFRYYLKGCLEDEHVESGTWGYDGGVQWTDCSSLTRKGAPPQPCWHRAEYEVRSIDERQMAYASRSDGQRYLEARVSSDFRLPGACSS